MPAGVLKEKYSAARVEDYATSSGYDLRSLVGVALAALGLNNMWLRALLL